MDHHTKVSDANITIIDAIMGSGKSTYAINEIINKNPQTRYLCVVPTIDKKDKNGKIIEEGETSRYIKQINAEVYDPQAAPRKLDSLKRLISRGENIVTTHALIQRIDTEAMELLRPRGYTLIIDECLEVISKHACSKDDVNLLYQNKLVHPDENGFLIWDYHNNNSESSEYSGKFSDIKLMCDNHCLRCLKRQDGSFSKSTFIWHFPPDFFRLFKETFICTYLWNGSFQKSFFDLNDIQYKHCTLSNGKLSPYDKTKELELRKIYGELINLYDGKLNHIGMQGYRSRNPLSSSWYKSKTNAALLPRIQKDTYNYFHNIARTPSKENMYTVFKEYQSRIAGSSYTRGFVPCTCKATNRYKEKASLAYLINCFPQVDLVHFFEGQGCAINQDLYALSEMLQWIWRSRIRERKPINLYLPSERMRKLLNAWISGEI